MIKKYILLCLLMIIIFTINYNITKTKPLETTATNTEEGPTPIGTYENFIKILEEANERRNGGTIYFGRGGMEAVEESAVAKDMAAGGDYSTTNTQVNGVDEADIIKNDGDYIYQLNDQMLVISKVTPVTEMKVVYTETFHPNEYYPQELYLDGEFLIVIGVRNTFDKNNYLGHKEYTNVRVYQLNQREDLELVRELEVEGYYISSRKINQSLYLITNKHLPVYLLNEVKSEEEKKAFIHDLQPSYMDTAIEGGHRKLDWSEIYCFPQSDDTNYLIVSGVDLSDINKPMSVETYLGAGQTIYASREYLYVTRTVYKQDEEAAGQLRSMFINPSMEQETKIYKFGLKDGEVSYLTEGTVKGALLNQFSMDEHDGYFRVATTYGDMWTDTNPSENLLFILDKDLKVVGSIEGIAPGERIFSARFMGDRGYIVTFKQVDPLFVLDLDDPQNPTILGELKIPGFSDYLHPYDENHIIGFGRDTVENDTGGAMVKGFKMALFDITDVNKPKEKFVEIIGGSGTHSELLYNHKALLFSKEKNLIAFPIELYEEVESASQNMDMMIYPISTFQGGYVYGLDLENGFELKSKITHYGSEELSKNYHYDFSKHIRRMIYIDDSFYTISNGKIGAHDISTFELKGELLMPK